MKPSRSSQLAFAVCQLTIVAVAGWMYLQERIVPAQSLLGVALVTSLWQLLLWVRDSRRDFSFEFEWTFRRPHYLQIFFQGVLYMYWALYWHNVRDWAPLILAQVALAYILEGLLSWTKHRTWLLGFGPWPIVGSVNLFFWFQEDYFYLQLAMIAATQFTKEFVTWNRNGRRTHIFNPSAIVTGVAGMSLMLTGRLDMAFGPDLINSFIIPPSFFEILLFVGLVVQFLFSTTLVTLGTALSLSAIFFGLDLVGMAPQTPFDASVMIGFTLLITDPQTSPRSKVGKLLFGLSYGIGIFVTYGILRSLQQPSFFDKIFPVIVLNLLVDQFDTAGNWITAGFVRMRRTTAFFGNWFLHIAAYTVLFIAILPSLKHRNPNTYDPYPPVTLVPSPPMQEQLAKAMAVDIAFPDIRKPFGFRAEIEHFGFRKELNEDRPDIHARIGQGLMVLGEVDMAIERFERAASEDPQYVPLLQQAQAARMTGPSVAGQ